jgi:hypothetical protein
LMSNIGGTNGDQSAYRSVPQSGSGAVCRFLAASFGDLLVSRVSRIPSGLGIWWQVITVFGSFQPPKARRSLGGTPVSSVAYLRLILCQPSEGNPKDKDMLTQPGRSGFLFQYYPLVLRPQIRAPAADRQLEEFLDWGKEAARSTANSEAESYLSPGSTARALRIEPTISGEVDDGSCSSR